MRPRKGDIYVVVRHAEGEVKVLLERDKATEADHQVARELGMRAIGMLLAKPATSEEPHEGSAFHHEGGSE